MDEKFKKEKFKTLSIKASVDKKFWRYCKAISRLDILEHADPPKAHLIGTCRSGGC